jgi:phosphodiesterase/alkaline phosphatase D-like protein
MNKLSPKITMMLMIGSLLYSIPVATQVSPTTQKAARVQITKGPEMERVDPDFAIISWTSNNPGGSPEHYGVVHYGTNPTNLSQTAKNPIRLNRGHSYTVFRVRMPDLKPGTTYYYKVESMESNGKSDGVKSGVKNFTTKTEAAKNQKQ